MFKNSPNHMVSSSGPLTLMKLAWHSLAMAFASSVFPQPATTWNQACAFTTKIACLLYPRRQRPQLSLLRSLLSAISARHC